MFISLKRIHNPIKFRVTFFFLTMIKYYYKFIPSLRVVLILIFVVTIYGTQGFYEGILVIKIFSTIFSCVIHQHISRSFQCLLNYSTDSKVRLLFSKQINALSWIVRSLMPFCVRLCFLTFQVIPPNLIVPVY